jgi:3'(2'), 5'-bisphosphate nucleotidase
MAAPNLSECLAKAIEAATLAREAILSVYHSGDFQTESKDDHSPLTQADKSAHQAIVSALEPLQLPILSEEGKSIPYADRKDWPYFWMIDPLDGTKEFVKRNGEFTVNIALIHQRRPVLGVVHVPVTGDTFYAREGEGAFVVRNGHTQKLSKRTPVDLKTRGVRVVASRSHLDERTDQFIKMLDQPVLLSKGSSIKFLLLAEGVADIYPRYAPTMEWDTAAAHIIVKETGLSILQDGADIELAYNKENLLNPFFVVR